MIWKYFIHIEMQKKIWIPLLPILLSLIFIWSGLSFLFADYSVTKFQDLFTRGNDAYKKGDFNKAIEYYEKIKSESFTNGYLQYNLGNAYYKAGKLGKAILYYKRAQRLIPRYQDLETNLAYVKMLKVDKELEKKQNRVTAAILLFHSLLNINETATITSLLFLFILIIVLFIIYFQKYNKFFYYIFSIVIILFLIFGISFTSKIYCNDFKVNGIVIAPEITVRSGPSDDYTVEFKLHEGTEARIAQEHGEWIQIAISDEMKGWCRKESIEII